MILWTVFGCNAGAQQTQDAMKPNVTNQSEFDVIGIEARTNNAAEATGNGAIPKQWQRLFMENLLSQIPDRSRPINRCRVHQLRQRRQRRLHLHSGSKGEARNQGPEWDGGCHRFLPESTWSLSQRRARARRSFPRRGCRFTGTFRPIRIPREPSRSDCEVYSGPSDPNAIQAHIFIGVK